VHPHRLLLAMLLTLAVAACREEIPPPEPLDPLLELHWRNEETLEVREERVQVEGVGTFPAAGDIRSRATREEKTVDLYEDTVISGGETELHSLRRVYLSSLETSGEKTRPTIVDGKTYLISDPLGACVVRREEKGEAVDAKPKEVQKVRLSVLRIAASLLPSEPIPLGSSWRPGRDLSHLAIKGQAKAQMSARLVSVEETEGRRVGTVECKMNARIPIDDQVGANLTVRETLLLDLDRGHVIAYHSRGERYYPPLPRRRAEWVYTETEVSVKAKK
jgi:hypothetical protein